MQAGDVVDQVDDRPSAGRRGRPRSRHHRAGDRHQMIPPTINLDTPDPGLRPRLRAAYEARRPPSTTRCRTHSASAARTGRCCSGGYEREQTRPGPSRARRPSRPPGSPHEDRRVHQAGATREWQLRINDARTWIREQDASFEMNEPDAYALEEALRLKEKHGGEVVVCSAGPARVAQVHPRGAGARRRPRDPRRGRRARGGRRVRRRRRAGRGACATSSSIWC